MDTSWICEIEFSLCERFHGFNLYNLDETDVDTLIPFFKYLLVRNGVNQSGNKDMKYKNGKQYVKTTADKAAWAKNLFI